MTNGSTRSAKLVSTARAQINKASNPEPGVEGVSQIAQLDSKNLGLNLS
jgi:hypothetical protein